MPEPHAKVMKRLASVIAKAGARPQGPRTSCAVRCGAPRTLTCLLLRRQNLFKDLHHRLIWMFGAAAF